MTISIFRRASLVLLGLAIAQAAPAQTNPSTASAIAAVRANPANPEASFRLAQVAAQTGDFRTAISALERILILNPNLANIKLELGILYLRAGSPALAESYISEALQSPDVPPEVRARAAELQLSATEADQRLRIAGSASLGLISDTNANSGPAEGTTIGTLTIDPDDAETADVSAFASVSGRLRYDLGLQAGHLAALDVDLYTRQYADQSDLNTTRLGAAVGVDLNTARTFGFPSDVLLRYAASTLSRDGEDYLTTTGPSVTFRAATEGGLQTSTRLYSFEQDYQPTTAAPANDNRDGRETGLSFTASRAIDDVSAIELTFAGLDKSAEEGFEAYQQFSLGAAYTRQIDPLYDLGAGDWIVGLGASVASRSFDAPDPVISATEAQSDTILSVNASLSVPLNDTTAVRTELGYISQSSNYDLDTFDNTYVSVSLSRRF